MLSLTTVSISPTGLHQSYSSHAWTELLQAWDLTCGTFFRSSCVIQTFLMDCSDDSWRNTFFRNHEHSALWLLICWHHRMTLTYLLTNLWYSKLGLWQHHFWYVWSPFDRIQTHAKTACIIQLPVQWLSLFDVWFWNNQSITLLLSWRCIES